MARLNIDNSEEQSRQIGGQEEG